MNHRNAPLTPEGRLRLIERCRYRPVAHIAAEAGVSRACLSKWRSRYLAEGVAGLQNRSSAPYRCPTRISSEAVVLIEQWRRRNKWPASRIAAELAIAGHRVSVRTVGRYLERLGLNRRSHVDVDGEPLRRPGRIVACFPGHMVHLDVKKVGRIPDGGGWRIHGRGSVQDKAAQRAKRDNPRPGYVFLHSAVDGYSRLAYTEHLPDETATTTIAFWRRAQAFFAAHGIDRIVRVVTDNGPNYRSDDFAKAVLATASRHQKTRPYTPRHNGKVERYHRILADELLYARAWTSETQRADAIHVWNIHYNYHRPHSTAGGQPPATRLPVHVTNVMTSYS